MPVNTSTQQVLLLVALMEGPKTTIELRDLAILCPNPRICELRKMGFHIVTLTKVYRDKYGEEHEIGYYLYQSEYDDLNKRGQLIWEKAMAHLDQAKVMTK